ncbi:hypothetical protein CR513_46819, partial [Mucuna pruriens]
MIHVGFKRCEYDYYVYVKSFTDDSFFFLLLYVNDMLINANHLHDVNELKNFLRKEFDAKNLSVAKKILGMDIHRDKNRFDMSNATLVNTLFVNNFKLLMNQCSKTNAEVEYT